MKKICSWANGTLWTLFLFCLSSPLSAQDQVPCYWSSGPDRNLLEASKNGFTPLAPHLPSNTKVNVEKDGSFRLSIPLLTVPALAGLDFPVTLNYTPGIKITQEASWVGLGWSLDLGTITRNVVGTTDYWITPTGEDDGFRDGYSVSSPAGGGQILQFPNLGTDCFQLQDWRPWKISYDTTEVIDSTEVYDGETFLGWKYHRKRRFIVITEDGTTYVYGRPAVGATTNSRVNGRENQLDIPDNDPFNRWHLTAVVSQNFRAGRVLSGALDPTCYTAKEGWVSILYNYADTLSGKKFYYTTGRYVPGTPRQISLEEITYPQYIITPTHIAKFVTEPEESNPISSLLDGQWSCFWLYHKAFEGLNKLNYNYLADDPNDQVGEKKRRLKYIRLYRNRLTSYQIPEDLGTPVQEIEFQYYPPNNEKRTQLQKVIVRGGSVELPPYEFTYWDPPTPPNNPQIVNDSAYYVLAYTEPKDAWVGFQGWYSSRLDIDDGEPFSWVRGNPTDGEWWNLRTVKYPTGASVEFGYETNRHRVDFTYSGNNYFDCVIDPGDCKGNAYGMGSRLLWQEVSDGHNAVRHYDYSYATSDRTGVGRVYATPHALYSARVLSAERYYQDTTIPHDWLFNQTPSTVLYQFVTETQPNGGAIRTKYSVADISTDVSLSANETLSSWFQKAVVPRGDILSIEHLLKKPDNSLVVVRREEFAHQDTIKYWKGALPTPHHASTWRIRDTITTTQFDEEGLHPVTTVVEHNFNPPNGLIRTEKFRHSDGRVRQTETRYVTDYSYTGNPLLIGDSFLRCIGLLKERNVVNAEVEHWVKDSASALTYAATLTEYEYTPSPKTLRPVRIYSLTGDITDYFAPAYSESNCLYYDFTYDTVAWYSGFDWSSEKVTSIKNACGIPISYQWGGDATQLISEAQNAPPWEFFTWVFEDSTYGFTSSPGTWVRVDGCYRQTDGVTTANWDQPVISYGRGYGLDLTSAVIEADVRFDNAGNGRYLGISKFNALDKYVRFELRKSDNKVRIQACKDGVWTNVDAARTFEENKWYHLRGEVLGDTAKLVLDGELLLTLIHASVSMGIGYPGLCTYATCASFDNVRYYPPAAQITSWTFDPATLFLKEKSDPTGVRTIFEHDGIGRLLASYGPHGEPLVKNQYIIDGSGTVTTIAKAYRSLLDSAQKTSRADGLGKLFEERTALVGDTINASTDYDNMGRVSRVYKSYYESLGPDPGGICGGYAYAETQYLKDPSGRTKALGAPGAAFRIGSGHESQFIYGANASGDVSGYSEGTLVKTRSLDENGTATDSWFDNAGNKVAVTVDPGTSPHLALQTLFTYDPVGNLTSTTPPGGGNFTSLHEYDVRGRMISTRSPDAGRVRFRYNSDGLLRFKQDSVQRAAGIYTYMKYDPLGRVLETGEQTGSYDSAEPDDASFPSNGLKRVAYLFDKNAGSGVSARYLIGKCARVTVYREGATDTTFFSYDQFGRIEWTLLKMAGLSSKKIEYQYDWQGGLTKTVYTDLGVPENAVNFFYEYDQAGRLVRVYSSQDPAGSNKILEATYSYLPTGQISRLQLGRAQGVDYVYNERDWVTQINGQNLSSSQDPGSDGANGVPVDRFGMVLGYHNIGHIGSAQGAQAQYNGNISWEMHNSSGLSYTGPEGTTPLVGNSYSYDKANRLIGSDFGYYTTSWKPTSSHDMPWITFDANGNITALKRYGTSTTNPVNRFRYDYAGSNNRLLAVYDSVTSQASTYSYDPNGNALSDQFRVVSNVIYDFRNLPVQATIQGVAVKYGYDANGQRIYKEVGSSAQNYYIRGADGETIAVYDGSGNLLFWNILACGQIIGKITPF